MLSEAPLKRWGAAQMPGPNGESRWLLYSLSLPARGEGTTGEATSPTCPRTWDRAMLNFLGQRSCADPTLFFVSVLIFSLQHLLPRSRAGDGRRGTDPAVIQQIRTAIQAAIGLVAAARVRPGSRLGSRSRKLNGLPRPSATVAAPRPSASASESNVSRPEDTARWPCDATSVPSALVFMPLRSRCRDAPRRRRSRARGRSP
jgi:hypothetical protein